MDEWCQQACKDRGRLGLSVGLFFCATIFMAANASLAAAFSRNDSIAFDIPAQPLSKSLQDFSAASGAEILGDARQTTNARAPAVRGTMSPRSALFLLLEQANLAPEQLASGAFLLSVVQPPAIRLPGDQQPYFAEIQRAFQNALCAEEMTARGRYRLALKFWIGPSGNVVRPVRLDTTGNDALDGSIDAVVSRIQIGKAPPADFGQPVALVISSGASNQAAVCATDSTPPRPTPATAVKR